MLTYADVCLVPNLTKEKTGFSFLGLYIYVCIYIGLCMYIFMYVCLYVCMYVCIYICIYIYIFMYVCIYLYMYTYIAQGPTPGPQVGKCFYHGKGGRENRRFGRVARPHDNAGCYCVANVLLMYCFTVPLKCALTTMRVMCT